jgi:hypothetical protein
MRPPPLGSKNKTGKKQVESFFRNIGRFSTDYTTFHPHKYRRDNIKSYNVHNSVSKLLVASSAVSVLNSVWAS